MVLAEKGKWLLASIEELQKLAFHFASKKINEQQRLEKQVTIGHINQQVEADLDALKAQQLIVWDVSLKTGPCTTGTVNPDHIIKGAVYYGDAVAGRRCLGYFLGSYNPENKLIEIDYFEKRCDSIPCFKNAFIPITLTAIAFYSKVIEEHLNLQVNGFAFIAPLPTCINKLQERQFELVNDYRTGVKAMIKYTR